MTILKYKLITTNEETNKKIYAVIDTDGKSYSSCSEDNEDFKKWVADGGTVGQAGESVAVASGAYIAFKAEL